MSVALRIPLLALLLVFAALASAPTFAASHQISAKQAYQMARDGEIILIDIRTPAEWRLTGLPANSVTSDWWQIGGRNTFLKDVLALTGGAKDKPIALICATGGRSAKAQRFLSRRRFAAVVDVAEGMLGSRAGPGWLARGLPTQPCPDC